MVLWGKIVYGWRGGVLHGLVGLLLDHVVVAVFLIGLGYSSMRQAFHGWYSSWKVD
jgi:hypothetical protein